MKNVKTNLREDQKLNLYLNYTTDNLLVLREQLNSHVMRTRVVLVTYSHISEFLTSLPLRFCVQVMSKAT